MQPVRHGLFDNGYDPTDRNVVKLDAFHRIALIARPIARFKPFFRTTRDYPEIIVVVDKTINDKR
jgi:hypothetical protein